MINIGIWFWIPKVNQHILQTIILDSQKDMLPLFQKEGHVIPIHFNRGEVYSYNIIWSCLSVTNTTDRLDIAEILLKVALKTP